MFPRLPGSLRGWSLVIPASLFVIARVSAQANALQFADALTGRALRPEVVAEAGASPWVTVSSPGYEPMQLALPATNAGALRVRVLLQPAQPPPELAPERIAGLRRADATVFVGCVVDDASGEAIPGVELRAEPAGLAAWTDAQGYFQLHFPLRSDAPGTPLLVIRKPGWETEVRRHLDLWPGGDWTLRVRLTRGDGVAPDEAPGALRLATPATASGPVAAESAVPDPAVPAPTQARDPKDTLPQNATLRVPRNIRVLLSDNVTVEYTALEDYCRRVLPSEWIASWGSSPGGSNSLSAGAVAIRTYAIGYVNNPRGATHDICATTACQVYGTATASLTDTAVGYTANWVMTDTSGTIPSGLTEYSAENNQLGSACGDGFTAPTGGCLYDPACAGESVFGHGRGLCQWGSARWATGYRFSGRSSGDKSVNGYPRRDWVWILQHYYPALRLVKGAPLVAGDTVKPRVASLNVRQCPGGTITNGTSCPAVATKSPGATGVILEGPLRITSDGGGWTWYRVQWADTNGWSVENYLERVFPLPAAPTNLTAVPAATNRVLLSWTDNSEVEALTKIDRAPAATGPWTLIGTTAANTASFPDTNVLAGSTWFYRVRAFNAGGDSANSPVASATTPGVPPTLATVPPQIGYESVPLSFNLSASAPDFRRLLTDFEAFPSETANGLVLFRTPRFSSITSGFLEAAPNLSAVVDVFPAHAPARGRVLRVSFQITNALNAWVCLTTADAPTNGNPVIALTNRLQFEAWSDRPLRVALGVRETTTAAGTAIGANGGTTGAIEWLGVTNVLSGQPQPTRTLQASNWTTLVFDLPVEPARSFSGGNGALATASSLGVLEHLVLVPLGGAGSYNVYLDNFVVLTPKTLNFALAAAAPAGATLGAATGLFSWLPAENQGPSTNLLSLKITDNNMPPLSATQQVSVVVLESNLPPTLAAVADCAVHGGSTLAFSAIASDPDIPTNTFTFSLDPGAPAGSTVDPATGAFVWATPSATTPTTNTLTLRVADNGTPPLSAARTFSVVLLSAPELTVVSAAGGWMLRWPAIPGARYQVQFKSDLTQPGWSDGGTFTTTGLVLELMLPAGAAQRFYRLRIVD